MRQAEKPSTLTEKLIDYTYLQFPYVKWQCFTLVTGLLYDMIAAL